MKTLRRTGSFLDAAIIIPPLVRLAVEFRIFRPGVRRTRNWSCLEFEVLPLWAEFLMFGAAGVVTWFTGSRLAQYAMN